MHNFNTKIYLYIHFLPHFLHKRRGVATIFEKWTRQSSNKKSQVTFFTLPNVNVECLPKMWHDIKVSHLCYHGDFNNDWLKKWLVRLLGLVWSIYFSTRVTDHSVTIIDNVITNLTYLMMFVIDMSRIPLWPTTIIKGHESKLNKSNENTIRNIKPTNFLTLLLS